MSEFSAFIAGLILGDATPLPANITNKKSLNSNIALQDIAFCQALRNIIDGLENYVRTEHPSPEEFIKQLLPQENFEAPYTDAEKKIILDNRIKTDNYVKWVEAENASAGECWDCLSAVRMIWRDKAHTPDIEHLDLLFGDAFLSQPIKANGRVYEYTTTTPLSGLANGFFDSIPAKLILRMCIICAQGTVAKYGYKYDYSRFESDIRYKKSILGLSKEDKRKVAYKTLLHDVSWFCKAPWSDMTHRLKDIYDYRTTPHPSIDKIEVSRRKQELRKIYGILTPQEIKTFSVDTIEKSGKIDYLFEVPSFIAVLIFMVAIALAISNIEVVPTILMIVASSIFVISITFALCYIYLTSKKKIDTRTLDYLMVLQANYYEHCVNNKATLYEELLCRVRNNS